MCLGPWYLVRVGRIEDAKKSLVRLARDGHYTEERLSQDIALMVHTNEMEKEEMKGGGYAECFRGTNRRRTEIVSLPSMHSSDMTNDPRSLVSFGSSSSAVVNLSVDTLLNCELPDHRSRLLELTSIRLSLQTAGMGVTESFNLQLSINSMYIVGTLCSWICE